MAEQSRRVGKKDLVAVRFDKNELLKGSLDGKTLYAWDAVHDCNREICPMEKRCTAPAVEGKCALHQQYLDQLVRSVLKSCPFLDESQMFKFGMQIIPLYSYLWRLKTMEIGLGLDGAEIDTKHGKRIHPVYKELRDTIKTIGQAWKDLGFAFAVPPTPPSPEEAARRANIKAEKEKEDEYLEGDPTHYDKLAAEGTVLKRRGVIR